jgi:DNA-directed RNA polymerase subunit H (RpoH/RPB5)
MSDSTEFILPVRKDADTIQKTVLTNVINMLHNRKWISSENLDKKIKEIISSTNDNQLYIISLDINLKKTDSYEPELIKSENFIDDKIILKIVPQKITSIGKSPIILEFINEYSKNHKILIVDGITDKQKQTLITNNRHLEIFNESFLMLDLMSFVCCPQYEVLSQNDCEQLLKTYNMTRRQMKKMGDSDPASLYLYLKQKQIVRIIRNSEITGKSIDYRIVVHR